MLTDKATENVEHFCTLFDSKFLPMGMSLHSSLMQYAQPFRLWILCMDGIVEQQLKILALPYVTLISLHEVETPALLAVKTQRSQGEYCWTMTPFTFQVVFERDAQIRRVTYLDADLFFFDHPLILLRELDGSKKHVLITEHAYAPEYDRTEESGRFCVQFLTFYSTPESTKVMHWWQARCLEWCFAKTEDGKFGDQKYLDSWPTLFPDEVHIVQQTEKTLAPWNVKFTAKKSNGKLYPVFYHFHGLRIIHPNRVRLYFGYQVGKQASDLYKIYLTNLMDSLKMMQSLDMDIPCMHMPKESFSILRYIKRSLFQKIKLARLN